MELLTAGADPVSKTLADFQEAIQQSGLPSSALIQEEELSPTSTWKSHSNVPFLLSNVLKF